MNQFPANIENPQNAQNPQQQAAQQPIQPKKKPRQTLTLKPQHFQKENGLQTLYKAIENTDFTRGQDNVEMTMKKITTLLKTWHYQMLPKYSFDYFLQRCKALGNHKFTQTYMSKVRRIHKGQDSWGNSQPANQDTLNNLNLDHLNPNNQHINQPQRQQTLEEKFQNLYRIPQSTYKKQENRMEVQIDQMKKMQQMLEDDEDDDQMMRQMEAMDTKVQQKKEILGNIGHSQANREQKNHHSDSEEVQYVPDGFDDIDFEEESEYN